MSCLTVCQSDFCNGSDATLDLFVLLIARAQVSPVVDY